MLEHITKEILNNCSYSGAVQAGELKLSASSMDSTGYYMWLQYVHGHVDTKTEPDASTMGSVFQLGADAIFSDTDKYEVAVRRNVEINGFKISGEIDLLDKLTNSIIDFKVLAGGGFNKLPTDYISNMSMYKFLWPEVENFYLYAFNKAGSKVKGNLYTIIDVTDQLTSKEDMQFNITMRTDFLKAIFDAGTEPDCDCDVFAFGKDSKTKLPNRCEHYCNYRDLCPNYQARLKTSGHFALKSLL